MSGSLSEQHPAYAANLEDWVLMRDSYMGERQIKKKGSLYLPPTSNQIADGYGKPSASGLSKGDQAYNSYRKRARYPNFVREAVQMAIGMMHSQPAKIVLPDSMKNIRSSRGEDMEQLLRRINTEQLISGRIGLFGDLPTKPKPEDIPYIATYLPERIINWDDGSLSMTPQSLNMVVLDETEDVRDGFSWTAKTKYRVLTMGTLSENEASGVYRFGVFEESEFSESALRTASYKGRNLDRIPFVFVNVCDLVNDPDQPPLLDLATLCLTIYRGEADYRQNLFMQGQDTFVTIGGAFNDDETVRVGAGQRVDLPMGGDAKYVGVSAAGLDAQRTALEDDRGRAGSMGAQTLDTVSRERESGSSLKIRMAARTADMKQIAMAGAEGLEEILRHIAEWIGEDPEKVEVEPNLEFDDQQLTGQAMVEMSTARNLKFPISAKSLHQVAFDKGLTKMTFEEEIKQMEAEKAIEVLSPVETKAGADQNPNNDPMNNKDQKDKQKEQTGGKSK
jgi:hypothetical protein